MEEIIETKTASAEVREKAQTLAREDRIANNRAAALATDNTSWGKNLDEAHRRALEQVASNLGLSIALGHLVVLGGNIFITIAGHMTHAHNVGGLKGWVEGKLPKEEWPDWGVPAGSWAAWKTTVDRNGVSFTEVGWSGPGRDTNQPVAKTFPGELARKRARARALSLAYPVGLTSVEEYQRGEEIPTELYDKALAASSVAKADPIVVPNSVEFTARQQGFDMASIADVAGKLFGKGWRTLTESQMDKVFGNLKEERENVEDANQRAAELAGADARSADGFI